MNDESKLLSSNRRDFLARSALIASTALIAGKAGADVTPAVLKEAAPIAVALGYKSDASDVDTAKYPKRSGAAGAEQFCSNCALYKGAGDTGYGTCSAIPGNLVAGAGWCNAWIPS